MVDQLGIEPNGIANSVTVVYTLPRDFRKLWKLRELNSHTSDPKLDEVDRNRTLLLATGLLLRYQTIGTTSKLPFIFLVCQMGFEPMTLRLRVPCSDQLSYWRII